MSTTLTNIFAPLRVVKIVLIIVTIHYSGVHNNDLCWNINRPTQSPDTRFELSILILLYDSNLKVKFLSALKTVLAKKTKVTRIYITEFVVLVMHIDTQHQIQ